MEVVAARRAVGSTRPSSAQQAMDPRFLELKLPLSAERFRNITRPSFFSDLGNLEQLPREIVFLILELLSVQSLLVFCQVNRCAAWLLYSMPTFRAILEFAPDALRGVVAISSSLQVTLPALYKKLAQRICDNPNCRQLAGHLWLPTLSRYCLAPDCKTSSGVLMPRQPLQADELLSKYNLRKADLFKIPNFRMLPCTFGNVNGRLRIELDDTRECLYDADVAAGMAHKRFGHWPPDRLQPWRCNLVQCIHHYDREWEYVTRGSALPCSWTPWKPRNCPHKHLTTYTEFETPPSYMFGVRPRQVMATVQVPWLEIDPMTRHIKVEEPLYCKSCLWTQRSGRVYDRITWMVHVARDCRVEPFRLGFQHERRCCGDPEEEYRLIVHGNDRCDENWRERVEKRLDSTRRLLPMPY